MLVINGTYGHKCLILEEIKSVQNSLFIRVILSMISKQLEFGGCQQEDLSLFGIVCFKMEISLDLLLSVLMQLEE